MNCKFWSSEKKKKKKKNKFHPQIQNSQRKNLTQYTHKHILSLSHPNLSYSFLNNIYSNYKKKKNSFSQSVRFLDKNNKIIIYIPFVTFNLRVENLILTHVDRTQELWQREKRVDQMTRQCSASE